ncbi:D-glycero-beta-D-manno-heptose-7-phosphate kinase [Rhodoferax sp. 4810]|uniref:Bifunctional protein HldE n=1 Tax=Thiospirillum jenense TaxID=1653858 RepID=A0A839H554_9GAMM|nr:D-glycero-beta-D-manno-heptose-7-phosphate kinase [Thiospirillum jenense]MBB1076278.1 D-glycero-beta-D-manno-heptose-7-phosphate kinase [Rhodoferax jenense]MBB1124871.1 D-glycero-beta-D-manno-heptose-7-phosphate kinase [Thiospirillum jenense]
MFNDPNRLIDHIRSGFNRQRVIVIGDLMLDRYLWGEVSRISPEAPVPIVRVQRDTAVAGGAANVARNLASLGAQVAVIGMTGDDAAAIELRQQLTAAGIDTTALLTDATRPTTTKTRVISQHQQMLRLDQEMTQPLSAAALAQILSATAAKLADCDAIVLSDYAKGVLNTAICQQVIAQARAAALPVLVDPKGTDFGRYRGATVLTPNRAELAAATGVALGDLDKLLNAAKGLRRELDVTAVLVTLGELGMALCDADGVRRIPARAREVFDVSGAGDTVIAVFTIAHSAGWSAFASAQLANLGGGVVVGHLGTAQLTRPELLAAVLNEINSENQIDQAGGGQINKVCSLNELLPLVQQWRRQGERIVFTNGCFDLLHAGHVSYLEQARQHGQRLIIGLNSDHSVQQLKGESRPIVTEQDRAQVLAALAVVDAVVIFNQPTPLELIVALQPDVLVKGADYRPEQVVGANEIKAWNGQLVLIPLLAGRSSSALIARLSHTETGIE